MTFIIQDTKTSPTDQVTLRSPDLNETIIVTIPQDQNVLRQGDLKIVSDARIHFRWYQHKYKFSVLKKTVIDDLKDFIEKYHGKEVYFTDAFSDQYRGFLVDSIIEIVENEETCDYDVELTFLRRYYDEEFKIKVKYYVASDSWDYLGDESGNTIVSKDVF